MIRLKGITPPHILLIVFTAFAFMGTFCLGAEDFLKAAEFDIQETGSVSGVADSFIPAPAEEPALVVKTEEQQFTPSRAGFKRIFNSCGAHGAAFTCYQPCFRINSNISDNINYIDIKNAILLKLRI
jgi:hypothetical protein